jgi:hypothetical protein
MRQKFIGSVGPVVLVTINPQTLEPVPIPRELWAAIEASEGRSIPAKI